MNLERQYSLADLQQDDRFYIELDKFLPQKALSFIYVIEEHYIPSALRQLQSSKLAASEAVCQT